MAANVAVPKVQTSDRIINQLQQNLITAINQLQDQINGQSSVITTTQNQVSSLSFTGAHVFTGSSVPSITIGSIGDVYIQTNTGILYVKTNSTTWTPQISAALTKNFWTGFHDGVYGWSTTSSSFVDPGLSTTGTFTQRLNNNFGSVVTASGGVMGITFTPNSGFYFIQARICYQMSGTTTNNNLQTVRFSDGTVDFGAADTTNPNASGINVGLSINLTGIYHASNISTTIKIQARNQGSANTFFLGGNGVTDSPSIEWLIFQLA